MIHSILISRIIQSQSLSTPRIIDKEFGTLPALEIASSKLITSVSLAGMFLREVWCK